MNKVLSQQLFKEYDFLFQDPDTGKIEQLMMFGFECGDGWYNILSCLFSELADDINMVLWNKKNLKQEIEKTQEFLDKSKLSESHNPRKMALEKQLKRVLLEKDIGQVEEIRLNIAMLEEANQRLYQSEHYRLDSLYKQMAELDAELEQAKRNLPRVSQVKEKFGTLSVYGSFPENKRSAVNMAAKLSSVTCEKCGAPGRRVITNNYHQTLCSSHSEQNIS